MDAVVAGDNLLSAIGYDGSGSYLRPNNEEYHEALAIAAILDAYNNGLLCNGT